ncbi:hypothetical protein R1flu_000301 [Riccia fluitans]|uniref:Uncharacterized protein n=1 Tax=Riccia fluitans TaxID=41844 RepID=A0ABD1Y026_9MARC
MSKRRKLFLDEASSSTLMVYQPLDREEASTSAVQGECRRIVPPSEVEAEFLKQTGRKYKKDAWQDIAPWFRFSLTHSQPRSEGWVVNDFKKFPLEGHRMVMRWISRFAWLLIKCKGWLDRLPLIDLPSIHPELLVEVIKPLKIIDAELADTFIAQAVRSSSWLRKSICAGSRPSYNWFGYERSTGLIAQSYADFKMAARPDTLSEVKRVHTFFADTPMYSYGSGSLV